MMATRGGFSAADEAIGISPHKKRPPPSRETGAGDSKSKAYFEDDVKLAWLAPFLILDDLIQLIVERSFSPTFSIGC